MRKKKKSYYLSYNFVKKLGGFSFYRLAVYKCNKLIDVVGYLNPVTNILFINFSAFYYYIYKGFDFISFKNLLGKNLREIEIDSLLMFGLYNWLFFSNNTKKLILPKKFWLRYLNKALYIIYYLLFRNLLTIETVDKKSNLRLSKNLNKILFKRLLIIENLKILL
jgi:hypothetical protein